MDQLGMDVIDLRHILGAWAHWKARNHALTGACTLGRLDRATVKVTPHSTIPRGIDVPSDLAHLMAGFEVLEHTELGHCIEVVKATYMRSHNASVEDVAEQMGISQARLYRYRQVGEAALLGWMMAGEY